jgi:hypothetical protein
MEKTVLYRGFNLDKKVYSLFKENVKVNIGTPLNSKENLALKKKR